MYWQSMLQNLETAALDELCHLAGMAGKMRSINLVADVVAECSYYV